MLLEHQPDSLTTHQLSELIVDELNHELARLDSREHIHAKSFLLDRISEGLGNFVVDIGIEQSTAYVLHCLGHIYLGYLSLSASVS